MLFRNLFILTAGLTLKPPQCTTSINGRGLDGPAAASSGANSSSALKSSGHGRAGGMVRSPGHVTPQPQGFWYSRVNLPPCVDGSDLALGWRAAIDSRVFDLISSSFEQARGLLFMRFLPLCIGAPSQVRLLLCHRPYLQSHWKLWGANTGESTQVWALWFPLPFCWHCDNLLLTNPLRWWCAGDLFQSGVDSVAVIHKGLFSCGGEGSFFFSNHFPLYPRLGTPRPLNLRLLVATGPPSLCEFLTAATEVPFKGTFTGFHLRLGSGRVQTTWWVSVLKGILRWFYTS